MATSTGFKQLCPSCEAMVPIRNPNLIGKKIDCPKCKYRFVVEDPNAGADEDEKPAKKSKPGAPSHVTAKKPTNGKGAPAKTKPGPKRRDDDDDDAPKKKKSGGGSLVLILGIGLGLVAVALLGIGAVFLFSDGGGSNSGGSVPGGGSSFVPPPARGDGGEEETKPEAPKVPKVNLAEFSNLLPNETDTIRSISIPDLQRSAVAPVVFKGGSGFEPQAFTKATGFSPSEMSRVITGGNIAEGWMFTIVRLGKAVNFDSLTRSMGLEKDGKLSANGIDVFAITHDLDPLSNFLFQNPEKPQPLTLHKVDPQTLVIAHAVPMGKFVEDKGKPKFLSQLPTAGEAGPGGPMGPGGSGPMGAGGYGPMGPGSAGGPPGGGGGLIPPIGGPMAGGVPGGEGGTGGSGPSAPPPPAAATWMTVKPTLKALLDRLEDLNRGSTPILLVAADLGASIKATEKAQKLTGQQVLPPGFALIATQYASSFGMVVNGCKREGKQAKVTGAVAIECTSETVARTVEEMARKALQTQLTEVNTVLNPRGMNVVFAEQPAGNQFGAPGGGGYGAYGAMGGYGAYGGSSPMGPSGYGATGGYGAMGGYGPMGPGGGKGFGPPGAPGAPGAPGGTGGELGEGGTGGGILPPGVGSNPNQPGGNLLPTTVGVALRQQTLLFPIDASIPEKEFDTALVAAEEAVSKYKGEALMAGTRARRHELADAINRYAKEKKQFPRGTAEREMTVERNGIPWPPEQRVSWLAEVLPYLGAGEFFPVAQRIDGTTNSWRDGDNLVLAGTLIPHFLDPGYADTTRWTPYPNLPGSMLANTHFVGIAGVGMDAARYQDGDAESAKKMGVFGYDRVTPVAKVTDGVGNTIVAAQVPPTYKRPWLAGGGATVMGVPEKGSVKPFVCVEYNGKKGTYAIMGDGKVRFVAETIADADFQALCTIAGGETVDVNKLAPEVKSDSTELKTGPAPTAPPKETTKPAPNLVDGLKAAAERGKIANDLKQIGLAYHNHLAANKDKAPAKGEDLAPYLENDARLLGALKEGRYVILFGVKLTDMVEGSSNTVLGYEKDVPTNGGVVLRGDGTVKEMTAAEFQAAPKAKGK